MDKCHQRNSFICGELARAIGYSDSSAVSKPVIDMISVQLDSFKREGVINWVDYFDGVSPRKRLIKVIQELSELPTV